MHVIIIVLFLWVDLCIFILQQHKRPPDLISTTLTSTSTTSTSSSSGNSTGATSKHSQTSIQHPSKNIGKDTFGKIPKIVTRSDDSDDEDNTCALSEAWTYQSRIRRWSRITDETGNILNIYLFLEITDYHFFMVR